MTFKIFRRGVITFLNYREHCGRLDCVCSAKRELAFELVSEILRAHLDGSDMASFDGVVLGSFVAQVREASDFLILECLGHGLAESSELLGLNHRLSFKLP